MNKLMIGLVIASLHVSYAHAYSAGEAAGDAAKAIGDSAKDMKERVRPGERTGTRVNAPAAARNNSAVTTGTMQDNNGYSPEASGINSHLTCSSEAGLSQLSRGEQEVAQQAAGAGLTTNGCVNNFGDPSTAKVVVHMEGAKLAALHQAGLDSTKGASKEQLAGLVEAETQSIMADYSISRQEALKREKSLCAANCDVDSKETCDILGAM